MWFKKQSKLLCLVLMLIFAVSITAYGQTRTTNKKEADKGAKSENVSVIIASSQTAGTMFQWVAPAASIITKYSGGVSANAIPTLGTTENMKLLAANEVQLATTTGVSLYQASKGIGEFESKKYNGASVIYSMYYDAWQIVVPKNFPGNTMANLKGKRVSLNVKGSGGYSNNMAYLSAIGINPNTYFKASYLAQGDSFDGIKNGSIDAYGYTGGPGAAGLQELANSNTGVKIISLADEDIKKAMEKLPGIAKKVIPSKTYTGVDYDVKTIGGVTTLVALNTLPEDAVYKIVKAIDEHNNDLKAALAVASYSTAQNTVKDFYNFLPIHPGAMKYFKEKGLIK